MAHTTKLYPSPTHLTDHRAIRASAIDPSPSSATQIQPTPSLNQRLADKNPRTAAENRIAQFSEIRYLWGQPRWDSSHTNTLQHPYQPHSLALDLTNSLLHPFLTRKFDTSSRTSYILRATNLESRAQYYSRCLPQKSHYH